MMKFERLMGMVLFIGMLGACASPTRLQETQEDISTLNIRLANIEQQRQQSNQRKQLALQQLHDLIQSDTPIVQTRSQSVEQQISSVPLNQATGKVESSALELPLAFRHNFQNSSPGLNDAAHYLRNAALHFNLGNFQRAAEGFLLAYHAAKAPEIRSRSLYWLAETHFRDREWSSALECYQRFTESYPQHELFPNVLLKMGVAYLENNNEDAAREVFLRLIERYPQSSEAAQARGQLNNLNS